jgi:FHA domain/Double zinc ribbon
MTLSCPRGHSSATADYCDQCGAPMTAVAAPQRPTVELTVLEETETSPSELREPCPVCGAPRSGDDRYCEGCGHDFLAPPPSVTGWEAVVTADRSQFERLSTDGVAFPGDYRERRFVLNAPLMRIGRRRGQPGEPAPEIDLADAPEDPGVSRLHAVLELRAGGGYAIRDLGSTNGTTVNDDPAPLGQDTAVPLADGDRIRIGAWTTITVRSR